MRLINMLKQIHKWLALLIGVQLLLWMASGLVFSLLSHDAVSGRHLVKSPDPSSWKGRGSDFSEILNNYSQVLSISAGELLSKRVYRVTTEQEKFIVDSESFKKVEISETLARQLAENYYAGEGSLTALHRINQKNYETRRFELPVWQVVVEDEENSHLYLSATTGQLVGIKTDTWRLFDIFWMLHIMDYAERNDFNNALIIFIALVTTFIAISGVWLIFYAFSGSDFNVLARLKRVPLLVNSETGFRSELFVSRNTRLIDALAKSGYQLPSNCGGGGSCGLCQVKVDPALPVSHADRQFFDQSQQEAGMRLACQLSLAKGISVELPASVLNQQLMGCRVISNQFKTPLIKELVLEVPVESHFNFNAGEYVLLHIPRGKTSLNQIKPDESVKKYWQQQSVAQYRSVRSEAITRSYSMANPPLENSRIVLNVRLALPENKSGESGKASSYLFSLNEGDNVEVSGPFGHFHASQNKREMILIGGGAGMAPLRSHIFHQLKALRSERKISFWFGARNQAEIFYQEDFEQLQNEHANFTWHTALSEEKPGSGWRGHIGFIHEVLAESYLKQHPSVELCDFYICGPPAMNKAVIELLEKLNVDSGNIYVDDFG